jgi:hypothetical protein
MINTIRLIDLTGGREESCLTLRERLETLRRMVLARAPETFLSTLSGNRMQVVIDVMQEAIG